MKKISKIKLYASLLATVGLSSFTSVFSKIAAQYPFLSPGFISYYFLALVILALYAVAWQLFLEKMPLMDAYFIRGFLFIFVCAWSVIFFKENISLLQILGVIIIIIGIRISQTNVE